MRQSMREAWRDEAYADERGSSVNSSVGAAIRLHKTAQAAVDALAKSETYTDDENDRLCTIAFNALRCVSLSSSRNASEAIKRALYIEREWRKMVDPELKGSRYNAMLSIAVRKLDSHKVSRPRRAARASSRVRKSP